MSEEKPFFSITILAYQVEEYIAECLDSVLNQTFQNFEIILVNPISQDHTNQICKVYEEKSNKIKLLKIENKGQLLNRVAGFAASCGKYLLCLDGDDRWNKNLLESIYQGISSKPSELIIFGHQRFQGKRIISETLHAFPHESVYRGTDKKLIYEKLISGGPINEMCMKAMSKELFLRIKEDFSIYSFLRNAEDALYSCYVVQSAESILYLDFPLYQYRVRENSITHIFRRNELNEMITVKTKIKEFMVVWQMDEPGYYELFYKNICNYFADWIYRCAVSGLPYKEKKALYHRLRKETLYVESLPFQNQIQMKLRHKLFVILFNYSDILVELYSKIFLFVKKIDKRR